VKTKEVQAMFRILINGKTLDLLKVIKNLENSREFDYELSEYIFRIVKYYYDTCVYKPGEG
jgi:hypothetical protein